jgi:oligogalacturonide lyase
LAKTPPKTWIDTDTGRRVIRLTDEPNSQALYFDVNAYTPDGRDMIYVAPQGIYKINLATLRTELVASGKVSQIVVGTRTRRVFFQSLSDGHLYVVDIDSKKLTQLPNLPLRATISSVNADETLLAGTLIEGDSPDFDHFKIQAMSAAIKAYSENRQAHIDAKTAQLQAHPELKVDDTEGNDIIAKANADATEARFASKTPEDIFTFNLNTGQASVILKGTDWLSHVQFSPTDPTQILYSHEGPSQKVDRVWTLRADGSGNRLLHERTDPAGIATHEFWGKDGKTVWFDLQKQRGEDFAVAGVDVVSGTRTVYHVDKAQASMHYNVSSDGTLFCGDGNFTAHGEIGVHGHRTLDRAWIELLRPAPDGTMHSTRLAHIPKNDYARSEPGVRFTPDKKMVIFTSNMFGFNYVFAVEVAKAPVAPSASE